MTVVRRLSLLLVLFAYATSAWAVAGRLRGTVKDPSGKPLEKVTIKIDSQGEVKNNYTATTNSKGEYIHIGIAPGKYRVTPVKEGYMPVQYSYIDLQVSLSDRGTTADFTMQPAAATVQGKADKPQEEAQQIQEAKKGIALLNEGKLDDGIASLKKALEIDPKLGSVHYNLGVAYQKKGDYAQARKHFEDAVKVQPDFGEAYLALGESYMTERIFNDATINALVKATEFLPDSYAAFYNLGACYANSGKHGDAEKAYRRAAELKPNEPVVHYQLGMSLLGQSKNAEAKAEFQKYLQLNPNAADRKEVEELMQSLQ